MEEKQKKCKKNSQYIDLKSCLNQEQYFEAISSLKYLDNDSMFYHFTRNEKIVLIVHYCFGWGRRKIRQTIGISEMNTRNILQKAKQRPEKIPPNYPAF